MDSNTDSIRKKYNRLSYFYDWVEKPIEKLFFIKWRKNFLMDIKGNVLEVGVGTGKNLSYYNYKKVNLVAIDLSEGMLSKAKEKIKKNNYLVELKLANTEQLPFKDHSFDIIICTFVLCSVPNPVQSLKEMKRVVKKNGKIILLEHMLSKNKLIAFFEHLNNPFTRFLCGCNVNRNTVENIKKCDLKITKEKNLALNGVFKYLEIN